MPVSKRTHVDAQRVLAIMDELKEKLTYLSVITPQTLEGLQSEEGEAKRQLLGMDFLKLFKEQIRLEELYVRNQSNSPEPLPSSNSSTANTPIPSNSSPSVISASNNNNSNNTTSSPPMPSEDSAAAAAAAAAVAFGYDDARETLEKLQKNTRDLCRKMKDLPNVVQELRNFQETRPLEFMRLIYSFSDMQEQFLVRLTTTTEEERARQEFLDQCIEKEEAACKLKLQLEKELLHIQQEREKMASTRSEAILKLKADVQDIQESLKNKLYILHEKYESLERGYRERFEQVVKELSAQKQQLEREREHNTAKEKEKEDALRKRKKVTEKDVNRMKEAHEMIMNEKNAKVRLLEDTIIKNTSTLKEMQEHFVKDNLENRRLADEKELEVERTRMFDLQQEEKDNAAILLQSFIRGILQRENFVKLKKAAKKLRRRKRDKDVRR